VRYEKLQKDGDLVANIFVAGGSYTVNNWLLAGSFGYYNNSLALATDYMGLSVWAEYAMDKITPYVAYSYLASSDVSKAVGINTTSLSPNYVKEGESKKSIDQNRASVGVKYRPTSTLWFTYEYTHDLRSKKDIERALLSDEKDNRSIVGVRFNF
jgi:predicted porin